MDQPIERVVDLLPADVNRLHGIDVDEARERLFAEDPDRAHSRYNALLRRLASFHHSARCGR